MRSYAIYELINSWQCVGQERDRHQLEAFEVTVSWEAQTGAGRQHRQLIHCRRGHRRRHMIRYRGCKYGISLASHSITSHSPATGMTFSSFSSSFVFFNSFPSLSPPTLLDSSSFCSQSASSLHRISVLPVLSGFSRKSPYIHPRSSDCRSSAPCLRCYYLIALSVPAVLRYR